MSRTLLDEELEEALELLENDEEDTKAEEKTVNQDGGLSEQAAAHAKRGFKINRAPLVLDMTLISSGSSTSQPTIEDTIQRTPVQVLTLEERAKARADRFSQEKLHQERLTLLAKQRMKEVEEKMRQTDELRRKEEEKQLEKKPEESDAQYLQRLKNFVSRSEGTPGAQYESPRSMTRRSRSPKHEDKRKFKNSRFTDFRSGARESRSPERRVILARSPVRCYAEETGASTSTGKTQFERERIVVEGSPEDISQNKLHRPLTGTPSYRMKRYRDFQMRLSTGEKKPARREHSEPPVKRGRYGERSLEEIGDAPETEEEYFRWRHSQESLDNPMFWEEVYDTPFTKDFDREDEDEIERHYLQWKNNLKNSPFTNLEINRRRFHALVAEDEKPRPMAVLTLREGKRRINPAFGQLRTDRTTIGINRFRILFENGKNYDEKFLKKIIDRSLETGVLSVDGEGKIFRNLQAGKGKPNVEKPLWLAIAIGDLDGDVYLFQSWKEIPNEVREILSNFCVTKIQSNIFADVVEFDRHGVELVGWADTQVIYRAFLQPEASQDGTDAQARFLGLCSYPFRQKNGKMCRFDLGFLDTDSKLHSANDMRIPFAILLRSAIDRAEELKMSPEENILPLCHEALDLVKSLHLNMNEKKRISCQISENWRPRIEPDDEERVIPHSNGLNRVGIVREMRAARADLFEPAFEEGTKPSTEELTKVVREVWGNRCFPSRGMMNDHLWPTLNKKICWNCASDRHYISGCPLKLEKCTYWHYNTGGVPKARTEMRIPSQSRYPRKTNVQTEHSILMCEELHHFCTRCRMRGHHVEAHNFHGMGELAKLFLRNCHKGLVTCLPYAELLEDQRQKLLYHHWCWSLSCLRLPAAGLDAAKLGLQPVLRRLSENVNQDTGRQKAKQEAYQKRNSRADPNI